MPTYDYACDTCGAFSATRPLALYREPAPCPECGAASPRAVLSAPAFAGMPGDVRRAHAVNERSAHEPKHHHGPSCGCGSSKAKAAGQPEGAPKSFPGKRPWMISH